MDQWKNRVALVTGASSGIGLCLAKTLVESGMVVVACARNIKSLEDLAKQGNGGKLHPYKCDLHKDSEVEGMFSWIEEKLGGVDVCINNAGYTTKTALMDVTSTEMRDMLDTNVVALVRCSQLGLKSMIKRGVKDGHVININSVLGHAVMGVFNFYAATKFAVNAVTQGFRKELVEKGLRIRVTSISPGRVETKFLHCAFGSEAAEKMYSTLENLQPEDIANSVLHVLSAPPHVQIRELIIEPIQPTPPGTFK